MKKEFIITKAHPQGFCQGVINAIKMTNDAINNPSTIKPIYILGSIVHNKKINNAFNSLGIKSIKLDDINNINKGTVIITAHGASPIVYKKILDKGLDIIDTTCIKVKTLHEEIKKQLSQNKNIYFLGKPNHEETLGVLGISNKIKLINSDDIDYNIDILDDSILMCQTTLVYKDALDLFEILKKKNPKIILGKKICDASYSRQMGVLKVSSDSDIVLVIGDKTSNNCNSLINLIKEQANKNCYLIEDISDLKNIDFNNINKIAITSAASTPKAIVQEVIDTLNNLDNTNYVSKIKDNDYIKLK